MTLPPTDSLILIGFGTLLLVLIVLGILLRGISLRLKRGEDREAQLVRLEARVDDLFRASEAMAQGLRTDLKDNRQEMAQVINSLRQSVTQLASDQSKAQSEFRDKLDERMAKLQDGNEKKLDEMRKTVDEHLQTALEKRITESFKTVAERLEAVQKGLGEMQTLATGVGDLKRVLTNVSSRGAFGEVQLEALIADMLTPDQYVTNFDCGLGGRERVEFAVRLPGNEPATWLPIDAKFPTEDYQRLLIAVEAGDRDGVDSASKALETRVRGFAKDIAQKYINPPTTTDWAILFLPTEGLYAEILRRPGLFEAIQRDYRITVAGPTNLQVLLSTFRLGYRQIAMNEKARAVMDVLGAVRFEFGKYGDQITQMAKSLEAVRNHVDKLSTRRNVMLRALRSVEVGDETSAATLLPGTENGADD